MHHDPVSTSFLELAKQHSAFLVALGSTLLTILGIITAIGKKDGEEELKRYFIASTIILVMLSFAGAHCMSEVASYDSSVEVIKDSIKRGQNIDYQHLYRAFTLASVLVYLVTIGFLEAIHSLARMLFGEINQYTKFAKIAQCLFNVVICLYAPLSVYLATTHRKEINQLQIVLISALITVVFVVILRLMPTFCRIPLILLIQLGFGVIGTCWFMTTFFGARSIQPVDLGWLLTSAWVTAVVSIMTRDTASAANGNAG